jgi:hypothetical protein
MKLICDAANLRERDFSGAVLKGVGRIRRVTIPSRGGRAFFKDVDSAGPSRRSKASADDVRAPKASLWE